MLRPLRPCVPPVGLGDLHSQVCISYSPPWRCPASSFFLISGLLLRPIPEYPEVKILAADLVQWPPPFGVLAAKATVAEWGECAPRSRTVGQRLNLVKGQKHPHILPQQHRLAVKVAEQVLLLLCSRVLTPWLCCSDISPPASGTLNKSSSYMYIFNSH